LQLAEDLASGETPPESLPQLRLFEQNGNLYSLDNRRLFAGQMADVDLPYRVATAKEINSELNNKFTTTNEGTGIQMRGVGYFSWCEQ